MIALSVDRLSGCIGAVVSGVDLSAELDDSTITEIRKLFLDHLVIFFRDQHLSLQQQVAFATRFSPLSPMPFTQPEDNYPDLLELATSANEPNKQIVGGGWHSDSTFMEQPPLGSVLYGVKCPDWGGDTQFANQYAAYEALSDGMKELLDGMTALHSGESYTIAPAPPEANLDRAFVEARRHGREVAHPVVRVHPETGRKALVVNSSFTTRFENMTVEESRPLLEFLYLWATQSRFSCRFRWQTGSVAMWDNRCTLRARPFMTRSTSSARRQCSESRAFLCTSIRVSLEDCLLATHSFIGDPRMGNPSTRNNVLRLHS